MFVRLIKRRSDIIAHLTERVGVYAELMAEAALMASGWLGVSKPTTNEYYDLSAIDPLSREHVTFQVKTLKRREDRGNNLVLFAKKGDGKPYEPDESADYYLGVLIDDGEIPQVFAMENRNISEYWALETKASERWVELPIALDRTALINEVDSDELIENRGRMAVRYGEVVLERSRVRKRFLGI